MFMPELRNFTKDELQAKIDHYSQQKDYTTARKFIETYHGLVEGFDRDMAEYEIIKMEKGEIPDRLKPQKAKPDKEVVKKGD